MVVAWRQNPTLKSATCLIEHRKPSPGAVRELREEYNSFSGIPTNKIAKSFG